jgi:probable F420-dependent oxidoreductase
MKVLTTLPQSDLRRVADAAKQAEADGYDAAMTMENKNDPFLAHAIAGVVTERMELGTSVAISFPRSPMVVANTCWDLQIASRGRFVLGIGPQIRPHNEKRFSVPWTPPVPRMREYVQALRAIWTSWEKGEKLDYRGQHYTFTLMPPYFVPASQHMRMVPITLAAVGPHSLRLAGEVGDGVRLHSFCTRGYVDQMVIPLVQEGMAKSGRSLERFEITGGGFVATGPDEETTAKNMEWVRTRIGFYGSTPGYWAVLETHGHGDLGRELNQMSKQGKWAEMTTRISDDLVHLFAAVGTHKEIAGAIQARFGGMCDAVSLRGDPTVHAPVPPDLIPDIQRLPTRFTGYNTAW